MLKSSLYDYSDPYILVSGTITVFGAGADDAAIAADRNNKQTIFKNCAPFTDCITEINNTQVDNEKDLHIVMPMYNIAIIIQKHLGVYINFTEMGQMII